MTDLNIKNPRHVAIIMDGNGRWAQQRHLPRVAGHQAGAKSAQIVLEAAIAHRIEVLSLFAFSSENWQRPEKEVNFLMDILCQKLDSELQKLHKNQVQLHFMGELSRLSSRLQQRISEAVALTAENTGLKVVVALSYGGRWELVQAARRLAQQVEVGDLKVADIDEGHFSQALLLPDLPEPDLFIRTSGEQRISNFFLWQLAYTEMYFPETLWPDFGEPDFEKALAYFATRTRRFGHTGEQAEQQV